MRIIVCGLLLLIFTVSPSFAAEKHRVVLQLKWTHAFQFAGYYAAKEKGFYDDAGLDVTIKEAQPESDVIGEVLSGKAQFGIGTSSLLLARQNNQPVVVLAVIFQHSPLVILSLQDEKRFKTIHDLVGKKVMFERQSEELMAYLQREKISPKDINFIPHSFDTRDLINKRVDAISAYVTNETYYLEKENIPYQVFDPRAAGIDFYGDNLFTSEYMVKNQPEEVAAFRRATLKGWYYAMTHKEEMVDIIYNKYSSKHPKDFYLHESREMDEMLKPELVEIGYMNPGRWEHITEVYKSLGMLRPDFKFEGFLYSEKNNDNSSLTHQVIIPFLGAVAAGLVIYILMLFKKMKKSVSRGEQIQHEMEETQEQYKTLIENATAAIYMLKGTRIITANSAIAEITGYPREELLLMEEFEFIHPDFRDIAKERTKARVRGENVPDRYEMKIRKKNGETKWIDHSGRTITYKGEIYVIGTAIDITENKLMREQLKISEERHRLLADNSLDVIWTMNLDGKFTYISPSVKKLRGYTPEEVMSMGFESSVTQDSLFIINEGLRLLRECIASGQTFPGFRADIEQPCKDGTTVWTEINVTAIYNEKNEFKGLLGSTRNITQRKQYETRIAEMKKYDPVTGLPKREFFMSRLDDEIAAAQNLNASGAILIAGIDNLKSINATFGFNAGDLVLKNAAERIVMIAEKSVSRIASDEFGILLPRIQDLEGLFESAEQIRKLFDEPFYVEGYDLSITVSIGAAVFPDHGSDDIVLIKNAEEALEQAKKEGKNRTVIYSVPL
jgi:diguanylate cyclase (GGDEF)-like protein/PAS domain S-box-containing protein